MFDPLDVLRYSQDCPIGCPVLQTRQPRGFDPFRKASEFPAWFDSEPGACAPRLFGVRRNIASNRASGEASQYYIGINAIVQSRWLPTQQISDVWHSIFSL